MAENTGFGRLPRGAKILWERSGESRTLSLGFFFATGSRFDPPGRAGTAHLVEHLVFKGTRRYTAATLARMVDRVGGDLNAWTDREEIAFTCTVPAEAWEVAVEALSELCFHPTFPPEEFEREKDVIRNEILASLEDPEDLSYEAFLQTLSPGDWSRPVAGTEGTLSRITLEDVRRWWGEYGDPRLLTVAFSGGVDPSLVERALAHRLEGASDLSAAIDAPPRFQPQARQWLQRAPFQMVQILGGFSFPAPVSAREAAVWQVVSMLWGETMSSRLFQTIREQRGLCYSVTSHIVDTEQIWGLQFFAACAPGQAKALLLALADEVDRLATDPPTLVEWEDARLALRGGVVVGAEKSENRTGRLWRQYETFGSLLGLDETLALLAVPLTVEERSRALSILTSQKPSLLVWGRLPPRFTLPKPWGT